MKPVARIHVDLNMSNFIKIPTTSCHKHKQTKALEFMPLK